MKLAKAIQIAIEAINLQRLVIASDANLLKTYHLDTPNTRACTELYQRYSDAINLLNELAVGNTSSVGVTEVPTDQLPLVLMETESAAAADHADTSNTGCVPNVVSGSPPGGDNSVTTQEELIYRDIERRR